MKYGETFLYFLCISNTLHFAVCKTYTVNDISEEIYSCDYTWFEVQLERMKLQTEINHENQLREQKELFNNLMRRINDLSLKIDEVQDKLWEANKINTENIKEIIRHETQPRAIELTPVVDDKIVIMIQIKDKLEKHDQILNQILSNQNDTKELIKEKIVIMEDHTQALKIAVADNTVSVKKIIEKLNTTEGNSILKVDQLKFCQDMQQHLNTTEISPKVVKHNLTSTNQSYPTSCADCVDNYCIDNKCLIKNHLYGPAPFMVACNNSVDGGGWTVIQRRIDGSVNFNRDWSEYKSGFGNMDGEFFIGLEKLHALTTALKPVELLIQLQDFDDVLKYAKCDDFQVANETENYKLIKVESYIGNAGDSFSQHVGYEFSTRDRDNDGSIANCARAFNAAWWYRKCFESNLNGEYYQHPTKLYVPALGNHGINWNSFHGDKYSLKSVQMLIRPRKFETNQK